MKLVKQQQEEKKKKKSARATAAERLEAADNKQAKAKKRRQAIESESSSESEGEAEVYNDDDANYESNDKEGGDTSAAQDKGGAEEEEEEEGWPTGTLVWGKVGTYPYWPGQIESVDEVTDDKTRKFFKKQYKTKKALAEHKAQLVSFFQSNDMAWVRSDRLAAFHQASSGSLPAPDHGKKSKQSAELLEAVELAKQALIADHSSPSPTKQQQQQSAFSPPQTASSVAPPAKKKAKTAAAQSTDATSTTASAAAESAGAGGGDTEVAELKRRYKALKGKNPKGKSSNDVDWIRARIADMESEQQQEGPRAARWAAAAAAVTATGQPRYQQSIYRGVTWDGQHWRAAAPIDYTGGNDSHQGSLQVAYHNQKTSKLGPTTTAVATPSPFLGYFDDEVDAAIR